MLCAGTALASGSNPSLATLTAEMLILDREAHALEGQDGTTPVYIGASLENVWLREIRVQIDALEPVRYQFSEVEARALQAGGLHLLGTPGLTPGEHRVRATLVAREASDKPNATRISAQLDRSFQVAVGSAVELRLSKGGMMSGASVELQLPALADGRQRSAQYLHASGRPFAAQAELGGTLPAAPSAAGPTVTEPDLGTRYNAATALYAQNPAQALAALETVGTAEPKSAVGLAVRDRANLALGYHLLDQHRGEEAERVFDRVRSPGPYANAAMLGLGWSYLLPAAAAGDRPADASALPTLRPGADDAVAAVRRQMPFRYVQAVASGERASDVRRALVPWTELIGRDPLDPAVQEGMLALPYALDHFGAHEQARLRYQQAIEKLEAVRGTLAIAAQQFDNGELLAALDRRDADRSSGWSRLLVEQRDDDEAVPLRRLAADPQFADALQIYRELRALDLAAATHEQALRTLGVEAAATTLARLASFRSRLVPPLNLAEQQLRQLGRQELQRIGQQTERYLAEAHFALARVYDRETAGVRR